MQARIQGVDIPMFAPPPARCALVHVGNRFLSRRFSGASAARLGSNNYWFDCAADSTGSYRSLLPPTARAGMHKVLRY